MQAGGRRFDPGWLHPQNPCVQAGFDTAAHAPALAASAGWKRFGSLPLRAHRSLSLGMPCVSPAGSSSTARRWQRWWCRWLDLAKRRSGGEARAEALRLTAAEVDPSRMTSPSYPPRRVTRGPSTRPWASEPKRVCSVRGWVSALLDFVPSVSPQGEAGGGEAVAKAPRWIKHDRGQSEPPHVEHEPLPSRRQQLADDRAPQTGGRSVPTPTARAIRQPV